MKLETWTAPGPDYEAAHRGVAVMDRRERKFLRGTGRAVGEMLGSLLTGRIPRDGSEAVYSLLLTPKAKMVSDLRVLRDRAGTLLLDLPEAGFAGTVEHFRKYLPPRLARVDPPSPDLALITLLGADGPRLLPGLLETESPLPAAHPGKEGSALLVRLEDGREGAVIRSADSEVPGLDLLVPTLVRETILARLVASGAVPMRPAVWATLLLEKGRPLFGVDMDQETLPPEAGLHHRAIDHTKGCYTGQEVIVRIRDRGQVNKRLVGLLLGDAPLPERGCELFHSTRAKSVGWVTRAVFSPKFGEGAALGYLRREVEPGEPVRLGGPDGAPIRVVALTDEGWALEEPA